VIATPTSVSGRPPVIRRRRPVVVLAITTGAVSLLVVPLLSVLGIHLSTDTVAGLRIGADIVASATAAAMLAVAASRRRGSDRWVWGLFATGAAGWCIGSVIWAVYLANGSELPAPSPADAFYLLLPTCWCAAGVVRSDRNDLGRTDRTSRVVDMIDSTTVGLSFLLVLWIVAFRVSGVDLEDGSALMTMVYPVAESVALTLLVRTMARNTADRRAFILLTAGVAVYAVGDVAFLLVTQTLDLSDSVPTLVDTAWIAGFTLLGGAAWIAMAGREPPRPRGRTHRNGVFPAVMGGVAAVVALIDLTQTDGATWTVATLVLIMVLLLARQSLTLTENRRLSTDLVSSVRGLEHQASHDALTGLPNREHLVERLHGLVDTADDASRSAVMFLDIDLLKPVNDSLGHAKGDQLIRTVGERLRARWGEDVVRFGGDEFVVLVRRATSVTDIERQAQQLVDDMRRPFATGGATLQPSVSVGVALVEDGLTPDELLRRSDIALYHAKSQGRGRWALFAATMDDSSGRRVRIAPELRRALDEDEFELHYQPVVELATGRILTVEALLRWRHPEEGLLMPDRFLAEADALGLLAPLGRRSLVEATTRFAEVNARDLGHPVRVTVNLSASELGTDVLLNVDEALAQSGLEPSLLVLEITEDVIIDDSVRRTLGELRARGVGIAIDDFGTGNSSLRQLGDYPASVLKIDRSFVDGIGRSDDAFIVRTVVELAEKLGLATVGEGVETLEQARLLQALGCVHGQGWLFDRAVPFDVLDERWLQGPSSTERALRILQRLPAQPAVATATGR
jgi:diguanylate cyclase (GGDEF)-like protein